MDDTDNEWAIFEDGPPSPAPASSSDETAELAKQLAECQRLAKELKAKDERLTAQIAERFDISSGTQTQSFDDVSVTVTYRERWNWDDGVLADVFPESLPKFVRRRLTVDRGVFERLSEADQELLRPALRKTALKPKVEVVL